MEEEKARKSKREKEKEGDCRRERGRERLRGRVVEGEKRSFAAVVEDEANEDEERDTTERDVGQILFPPTRQEERYQPRGSERRRGRRESSSGARGGYAPLLL